jgi:hypothetical protein
MLSFRTTYAITGELITAADAGQPHHPLLLVLHDRPIIQPDAPDARLLRVTRIHLPQRTWTQHPTGIPGVLDHLASSAADLLQAITAADTDARLLATAVRYDDLAINTDPNGSAITPVRRVEAVDTDGRSYQVTRLPGEHHGVALVDDQPQPDDVPATHAGLHALLGILRRQPTSPPTEPDRQTGTGSPDPHSHGQ